MYGSSIVNNALIQSLIFFADLSFLLSLKYNEFQIEFYTLVDIIMIYINIFYFDFFAIFNFFLKKNDLYGARAHLKFPIKTYLSTYIKAK
jgi:hypothetical protein